MEIKTDLILQQYQFYLKKELRRRNKLEKWAFLIIRLLVFFYSYWFDDPFYFRKIRL